MKRTTILIPTYNRPAALAVTLTSLCYQADADFEVVISDQSSDLEIEKDASVQAVIHLLRGRGHRVRVFRNLPARGIAQQRQFLLEKCDSPYCLYLDDDLILEPYVLGNLRRVLEREGIGFTANAVVGLSYRDDHRPHQQHIEFWDGPVWPEVIRPRSPEWHRYPLHNAATLWHVQQRYGITPEAPRTRWHGRAAAYSTTRPNCGRWAASPSGKNCRPNTAAKTCWRNCG